ncbi:MAG: hypothetical protein A2186_03420 [Candidatus Levybacteria bacterium RIFOXYA1_FULL_41_10]|nr:MAG: replication and repair protein RecF protein [Candidatus Levybacteria bacterium GW2011_GWA1_39_32]KKR50981.1 MAG: replication and repair protein RecF protein [Candidatus Levybacteria bacterium GW2011_GWC1_40_19]KKR72841.1 MAG: replication and repair protein RecF protein [Candidatus Levybacteria bacterium GW2011_GWC2_40_7]KKR95124.1 MAG: replication and repair protein RecF protein [Candidatus Levybacteria bacterium GW2011_GWA2_41_15]KKS01135.1 MAG: replication and repair protein RecF prot
MLKSLSLQSFRSYKKSDFDFDGKTTLIVGVNTSGKTNLIEAIFLLSRGKSFRTDKDPQMIQYEKDLARLRGKTDEESLEVVLTTGDIQGKRTPFKKFMVNGVSKRRLDFTGFLPTVLFSPEDLELIIGSPSLRRRFLNDVLEQSDRDYRLALISFEKGIRQRNALLDRAKDTGRRNEEQFEYWDRIVIDNGAVLTQKRQEYIEYLNKEPKEILDFEIEYDKSVISEERLYQYRDAELGAGVTLVGPHRDDFIVYLKNSKDRHDIKHFGSRGQQRLAILQLKLLELLYLEKVLDRKPTLLLDDVFSELDTGHIDLILGIKNFDQAIITTTHEEFVGKKFLKDMSVIKLGK